MGKNTTDGDGIIQVEWVESKSFLELTYIELKERDGQNRVGRKRILFFSERKTESRPRREKKSSGGAE